MEKRGRDIIKPNIVLIIVDCLRADHLSCHGYSKPTPNIDLLASQGTQYMNAWAAGSFTSESIPFILSEYLYLQLRSRGYAVPTVVHTNQYVTRYLVESKLEYLNIDLHPDSQKHRAISRLLNFLSIITTGTYHGEAFATDINDRGLKMIPSLPRPFFMCLWYMDVHSPYFSPYQTGVREILLNRRYNKSVLKKNSDYLNEGDVDRLIEIYDRKVKFFDDSLQRLLHELPAETIVVLTSDHGEELMERGGLGHHEAEIPELRHVPLIVKIPHIAPTVVDEPFKFESFDKFIMNIIDRDDKEGAH